MDDRLDARASLIGALAANAEVSDRLRAVGLFHAVCRDADGRVLWTEDFPNLVVNVGKNLILDQALAGSSWTATGPFMGLISSTSYSAIAAGDTMASHAGWLEAGNANTPTFSARITTNGGWNAASGGSKALTAGLAFTFTGPGTVQGAFLVGSTGAVVTIDSTAGTLISAGTLGTPQPVIATNALTISYSMSL